MGGRRRWGWAVLILLLALVLAAPQVGAETRAAAKGGLVQVPGVARVRAVAVGLQHFVAVDGSGGLHSGGIAIDEEGVHFTEIRRVETPFRPVAVAAGYHHYAALSSGGAIYLSALGACNPCTFAQLEQPAAVAVSAGPDYVASLGADGRVRLSDFGMSRSPMVVEGLDKVVAVSAGPTHLLAIRADGTAWHVTIVRGKAAKMGTPRQLKSAQGVTSGAAAEGFSVLRQANGQIVGITVNEEGVKIAPPDGSDGTGQSVYAGHTDHFLVLQTNGGAWWGHCNVAGRTVGAGQVSEILLRAVAPGAFVNMGIDADGRLYAWRAPGRAAPLPGWEQVKSISAGDGILLGIRADGIGLVGGMLPGGGIVSSRVQGPREVGSGMASGRRIALVATDGTVWHGQVTDDKGKGPLTVEQVPDLAGVQKIALAGEFLFALGADGQVRYAHLGEGGGGSGGSVRRTWVIPHILETKGIAASQAGFIANTADGSVWVAGLTADGPQEPMRVEGISGARAVMAGQDLLVVGAGGAVQGIAIDEEGVHIWGDPHVDEAIWGDPHVEEKDERVWGDPHVMEIWGDPHVNEAGIVAAGDGYLGSGALGTVWKLRTVSVNGAKRLQGSQVGGLTGVIDLASGGSFHAALRSDGTVWTWPAD